MDFVGISPSGRGQVSPSASGHTVQFFHLQWWMIPYFELISMTWYSTPGFIELSHEGMIEFEVQIGLRICGVLFLAPSETVKHGKAERKLDFSSEPQFHSEKNQQPETASKWLTCNLIEFKSFYKDFQMFS